MGFCNCVFAFFDKNYNFFILLIFFSIFTVLCTIFFDVKSQTKTLNESATIFYNMQQCICYIAYTLSPTDVWSAVVAFPLAVRQGHTGVKASVSIRFSFSPLSFHLSLSYIPSVFLWLFCRRIPQEPYRIITSIYNMRPFSSSFWHILLASTMGVCVCLLIILRKYLVCTGECRCRFFNNVTKF